jgi:hypothetical protein
MTDTTRWELVNQMVIELAVRFIIALEPLPFKYDGTTRFTLGFAGSMKILCERAAKAMGENPYLIACFAHA